MAGDPQAVVEAFVAAWNRMDFEAIVDAFTDDIAYHNVPMQPLAGRAAVRRYLESAWRFERCDWLTLNIAVNGDTVLTERIDGFVINGVDVKLPLMGIFRVRDGHIAEWRDYFDLAMYQRALEPALAASPEQ